MAATCPHCGKTLHIWNVKAECSNCGVSIPNYNWMERLEEDNRVAEARFAIFNRSLNRIKYSLIGTKLRIARLVLTFIPAVAFILPWVTISSDAESFEMTMVSFTGANSAIDMLLQIFNETSLITANIGFEGLFGPVTLMIIALLLYFLTAVFIVIAFFMSIIKCKQPKTRSTITFDVITIVFSIATVVVFMLAGSAGGDAVAVTYGEFTALNMTASISYGYYVAVVLFLVALGINIATAIAPAKTDEELENERVARAEAKAEKEKQDAIKKEKEREEAEKRQAEEQAKLVEEARAHLEEDKKKKEKKKKK